MTQPVLIHSYDQLVSLFRQLVPQLRQGQSFELSVDRPGRKASWPQHKRYRAMLRDIAAMAVVDGRQFSTKAWHEFFKDKYLAVIDLPGGGTAHESTADLDHEQMSAFMNQVEVYAIETLGLEFPR